MKERKKNIALRMFTVMLDRPAYVHDGFHGQFKDISRSSGQRNNMQKEEGTKQ